MNNYHITYRIPFGFNDILKKRRAVLAATAPAPVIAPNRKPTKNKKK